MKSIKAAARTRWALLSIPAVLFYTVFLHSGVRPATEHTIGYPRALALIVSGLLVIVVLALPALWATNKKQAPIPATTEWITLGHYYSLGALFVFFFFTGGAEASTLSGGMRAFAVALAWLYVLSYIASLVGSDTRARKRLLETGAVLKRAQQKLTARVRSVASSPENQPGQDLRTLKPTLP